MTKKWVLLVMTLSVALPMLAADKVDKRIADSTAVLQSVVGKPDGIPNNVLNKAVCVLVYPSVKKVGIGLGVSYGRGILTCRSGKTMSGKWSAPAMYTLDTGSIGAQLGGSSTDFVLLIMNQQGADKVLSGKLKLGADASASAGPSGANSGTPDVNADILTYARAKGGLFAGASLGSASMGADNDANKSLYNKEVDGTQIVRDGAVPVPASAQALIGLLDKASPKHM
jgi:lipid-binding SYLF domain-containing protein